MIEINLTKSLCSFLGDLFRDYELPVWDVKKNAFGKPRAPKVFNGSFPLRNSGGSADSDIPCIVVRPESADTDYDVTSVDVSIAVCVFAGDMEKPVGLDTAMEAMTRIRTALVSLPYQILDDRYQLRLPIKWSGLDEQPFPYWQINMTTSWVIPNPRPWRYE